jgi:hypothetical protein
MKLLPILAAAASAVLLLASCKNGTTGLPIPKDAEIVVHINASSLTSKLSWKDIQQTNWFREMRQETNDTLAKKILENPEASGIDIKSSFAFFVKKQGNGGYAVFEGKLTEPAAFEAFNKQVFHNAATQKGDDFKYISSTNNKTMVSWNDAKFIYITDAPDVNTTAYSNMGTGEQKHTFPLDSLKLFTKNLYSLKSSNSIEDDDHYSALIKESGDVHFWINPDQFMSNMGAGMFSMLKVNNLLQGNVTAATLNFDEGKIIVKSKTYYGKELAKIMDKYKDKKVSKDLVNRIPSQNVVGALAVNYEPGTIKEFLKASGFDGMANAFLGQYNYSLDELLSASKGELLFAVSDLSVSKTPHNIEGTTYTYTSTKTDANFLVAVSVNNKASFDKLMGIVRTQVHDTSASSKVNYKTTNDWFAFSNTAQTVDQFLAGGNHQVPFADKISGHPFGAYVDIQKLMKQFQPTATDSSDREATDASLKMWQDVLITGGDYKDGVGTAEFTINLVDKSTNSLKQLNQYAENLYLIKKKYRRNNLNTDAADSSVVAPPAEVLPAPAK